MTSTNGWTSESLAYVHPRPGAGDAWAAEARAKGHHGTQRLMTVDRRVPPSDVQAALALDEGREAVLRRRLVLRDDQPVEIVDSWYPADIADGTPLAEPRKIAGGAPAVLAAVAPTVFTGEEVESRKPTPEEQELLGVAKDEPMLVLTRLNETADHRPSELCVMVASGKERRLRYEMRVS